MSDIREITEYVLCAIISVNDHPMLYGTCAEGIDANLNCYHCVWAKIEGREQELQSVHQRVREAEKCGPYPWAVGEHATEDVAIASVLRLWRKVDEALGIEFPEPGGREKCARNL